MIFNQNLYPCLIRIDDSDDNLLYVLFDIINELQECNVNHDTDSVYLFLILLSREISSKMSMLQKSLKYISGHVQRLS